MFIACSCISEITESPQTGGRRQTTSSKPTLPDVKENYGLYIRANPVILSGNPAIDANVNLLNYLEEVFITDGQVLEGSCGSVYQCYSILEKPLATPLTTTNKKWAYDPNTSTSNFLQVHSFAHTAQQVEHFQNTLQRTYNYSQTLGNSIEKTYQSSIPATLFSDYANWMVRYKNNSLQTENLILYANEPLANDAFFRPATFTVHLGYLKNYENVKFSQDASIIYHEIGHALSTILINIRNASSLSVLESSVGYYHYDEAGCISEALSDYFSYAVNARPHFAEWALGRFLNISRPMTEDDPLHIPGIASSSDSRLSYPMYLNYEANYPDEIIEDIHNCCMIASHYLVALTEDLKSYCGMSQETATANVLYLLTETLAELGDLTATGHDGGTDTVNLNSEHALEWLEVVNPISYRKFFQTFTKYLYQIFNQNPLCNGSSYPKDNIEKLLDDYGLLLFKTYNEDKNNGITGHSGTHTAVTSTNRVKSLLISKDLIKMDPRENASQAYLFDKRSNMISALERLQASGLITEISEQIEADLPYNNGNKLISPGEFIGLALNIYNDSNSPMAGIQVLGNDWDHFKWQATEADLDNDGQKDEIYLHDPKPCNTFEDQFPLDSEGAASEDDDPNNPVEGDCNYITRSNGGETKEKMAPVCMVQISDDEATKWASQIELMTKINLSPSNCLSGKRDEYGNYITKDCFVRAVKGVDNSWFSKIDPKKNWSETMTTNDTSQTPTFNFSNIIFFEISPWIPPGTVFQCRFRVRFTNCDTCFTDANYDDDDYLDYEYSGATPFKIVHFQFTVID